MGFFVFLVKNYTFRDGESKHLIFRQGRRFREQRRGRALVPKGLSIDHVPIVKINSLYLTKIVFQVRSRFKS